MLKRFAGGCASNQKGASPGQAQALGDGEQIKKKVYNTREKAWSEVFDYIEGFYNRARRHIYLNLLSSHEFDRRHIAL